MPFCDVYVSGFPCQPWSTAGLSKDDRHGRGCIFPYIHEYIKTKWPKCFLLENVKGFTNAKHKDAFANVLKSLRSGLGDQYMVSWRVVNTADYGLPQNRPRLYIVGMLRVAIQDQNRFKWPRPVGCVPLASLLETGVKFGELTTHTWHAINEKPTHDAPPASQCRPVHASPMP